VHAPRTRRPSLVICQRRPGQAGRLFVDHGEPYPVDPRPAGHAGAAQACIQVDLWGGSYWLYAEELRNDSLQPHWVIDPNDTLIDMVDIRSARMAASARC
jgi:hypothetical protein